MRFLEGVVPADQFCRIRFLKFEEDEWLFIDGEVLAYVHLVNSVCEVIVDRSGAEEPLDEVDVADVEGSILTVYVVHGLHQGAPATFVEVLKGDRRQFCEGLFVHVHLNVSPLKKADASEDLLAHVVS